MAKTKKAHVTGVKDQYEVFPYPLRAPEDDRKRLVTTLGGNLDGISHFAFDGRRDFSKPLRLLVAGGGTGDALIYLAQQLADRACPAEVVYIDLSTASRAIAEARAAIRGLTITFVTGSLLDVGTLAPGPYDYIDCSGVLHHLPDPDAGLAALAAQLAPDGAMGIMLYGTLGRSGVYPMQALLRTLAPDTLPAAERLAIFRKVMASLPATNLLRHNPVLGINPQTDDNELFDMFLHSQDRSYTVEEIGRFAAGSGLRVTSFIPLAQYDPAGACGDPQVLKRLDGKSMLERAAVAEALHCLSQMHVFYLVRQGNGVTIPSPTEDDAVPVWHDGFAFPHQKLGGTFQFGKSRGPVVCQITVTAEISAIASRIDGNTSLGAIRRAAGLSPKAFAEAMAVLWRLNGVHFLFLRRP
ncbi:MAG: class I SAM-dependent methyltransferase [Bacteroidota bacterium]